jgi:uncharacterized protein
MKRNPLRGICRRHLLSIAIKSNPLRGILRRSFLLIIILLSQFSILNPLQAQTGWLPAKSSRLVNDYSGILSREQAAALEQRLVAFNDSTSNQIVVVITPTLGGDDENAVAQRIGQAWGVGQQEHNNGLVILIKSKTREENWGAVAISTGYGLEGALPDVFCKRIIDDKMLDLLADGHYYAAIVAALDIVEPVCRGEYSYAQYRKEKRSDALFGFLAFLAIITGACWLIHRYNKKHPNQGGGRGGSSSGGNGIFFVPGWGGGGFSGGGFSGGGFGGFGGGSFGGGGASGRF